MRRLSLKLIAGEQQDWSDEEELEALSALLDGEDSHWLRRTPHLLLAALHKRKA